MKKYMLTGLVIGLMVSQIVNAAGAEAKRVQDIKKSYPTLAKLGPVIEWANNPTLHNFIYVQVAVDKNKSAMVIDEYKKFLKDHKNDPEIGVMAQALLADENLGME